MKVSSNVIGSVLVSDAAAAAPAPKAAKSKEGKSKKVEANKVMLASSNVGKVTTATTATEVAADHAPKAAKNKVSTIATNDFKDATSKIIITRRALLLTLEYG
jgi:hypothetical protein